MHTFDTQASTSCDSSSPKPNDHSIVTTMELSDEVIVAIITVSIMCIPGLCWAFRFAQRKDWFRKRTCLLPRYHTGVPLPSKETHVLPPQFHDRASAIGPHAHLADHVSHFSHASFPLGKSSSHGRIIYAIVSVSLFVVHLTIHVADILTMGRCRQDP